MLNLDQLQELLALFSAKLFRAHITLSSIYLNSLQVKLSRKFQRF